ncbi:MAG: bifunctional phosphoglucose/phosphomannose isomerase [Clostridiales bacterium]|nr:bifunctional phosphoglucose/phosphomannose isomerase [Clostridiales bacterium]MCF8021638.1 bifunctional phosphoglucose/phosphomannose isomerase [Clostridiales bacterium]
MDIESLLNDAPAMYKVDSMDMFGALSGLPEQCKDAWKIGMDSPAPEAETISNVLVTGMGGSAIGGDLLRAYASGKMAVPVAVNRDYTLSQYADKSTLVIAVSYSGNTEETLSVYEQARKRECTIAVITTGGKLKESADKDGVPVIKIPGGLAPRAATGYLFIPALAVMQKLGLLKNVEDEIKELEDELEKIKKNITPESALEHNAAKQLAREFYGRIPVIWGAAGTTGVAAQRYKGQVNENAKAPAYWNVFPELNHNELVGFEVPRDLLEKLHIVMLKDKGDHERIKTRMEITRGIAARSVSGVTEISSSGEGLLARMYTLIYVGDYASVYLAVLYDIDPGPVKIIDYLKSELAGR